MNWRILFYISCLEILIDGFLIYFLFPSKSVHFIKDALVFLTLGFFLMKEPLKDWTNSLGENLGIGIVSCMAGLFLLCLLQMFNPLSPGLLRGVLGMKLMFLPWVGILLGYAYANNTDDVSFFFRLIAFASIPVNAFGLLQYVKGPGFMISTFGPGFALNSMVAFVYGVKDSESFLRIFSTFASSAHYGLFLSMNSMIGFGLYFSDRRRLIWMGIILLNFCALLATGSRGAFVITLIIIAVFLFFARRSSAAGPIILISFLCLFMGFSVFRKSVTQRFQSAAKIDNLRERTIDTAPKQFTEYLNKFPMGRGIGAASQASRHLGKQEGQFFLVENYVSKMQLELGIVGVILFYLLMYLLMMRWANSWLPPPAFSDHPIYFYALALTAYGFGQFTVGTLFSSIDTPPACFFLWVIVGMMIRVPSILETPAIETQAFSEE